MYACICIWYIFYIFNDYNVFIMKTNTFLHYFISCFSLVTYEYHYKSLSTYLLIKNNTIFTSSTIE